MQQLIYGCMRLGGPWEADSYTSLHLLEAERAVEAALEIGITVFDHADIYRAGKSERIFGELIRRDPGLRHAIRIQSKCGIRVGEDGLRTYYNLGRTAILDGVAGSLDRLGTDHLDTLLLHRVDPLTSPEEIAATLTDLHRQGMVRAFGVSNMSASQIQLLQSHLELPLTVNQLELSLKKRDFVEMAMLNNQPAAGEYSFPEGTVEYCQRHGIAVQAWGPLVNGLYSGASLSGASATDRATAELVAELAEQHDVAAESIVLGWLMKHPARISPVVGTTDPVRIRSCGDAAKAAAAMTRVEWYSLLTAARGAALP